MFMFLIHLLLLLFLLSNLKMEFQIGQNQFIAASLFGAKFRSKGEVLRFLVQENNAYLPSHYVITLYFMRDLISGKKKVIFFIIIFKNILVP